MQGSASSRTIPAPVRALGRRSPAGRPFGPATSVQHRNEHDGPAMVWSPVPLAAPGSRFVCVVSARLSRLYPCESRWGLLHQVVGLTGMMVVWRAYRHVAVSFTPQEDTEIVEPVDNSLRLTPLTRRSSGASCFANMVQNVSWRFGVVRHLVFRFSWFSCLAVLRLTSNQHN